MKLFLLIINVFFLTAGSALAYLDDAQIGDAEATAGDQNTNLYRLKSQGGVVLKQLKKVDEFVARNRAAGREVDYMQIDELLLTEQQEAEKQQLQQVTAEVKQAAQDYKKLKKRDLQENYQQIIAAQSVGVRDAEVAAELRKKLLRSQP